MTRGGAFVALGSGVLFILAFAAGAFVLQIVGLLTYVAIRAASVEHHSLLAWAIAGIVLVALLLGAAYRGLGRLSR